MKTKASDTLYEYVDHYYTKLAIVDLKKIDEAYDLMIENINNVVIFGNGGSAGVADHFCCDFVKGIRQDTNLKSKCISLSSNGPLVTAIANDYSYDEIFSKQIQYYEPSLAIAVSSSGNSKNILNGLLEARINNVKTIALVGFNGGEVLKQNLADVVIQVPCHNYGVVEDSHMSILHSLVQTIRFNYAVDRNSLKL